VIPDSLNIPSIRNFPSKIPRPPKTTHKRRKEVIKKGSYINENIYNERYKQDDVKIALKNIYHSKCAFCEQKIEQFHVEHYRPKQTYYWLAFSWDNLLLSCATCNTNKDTNFDVIGHQANLTITLSTIRNINNISAGYDITERPKMVNPEVTDPEGEIQFSKNGSVQSNNPRFAYTIDKCKIDRTDLNDSRRKILDDFEKDIISALSNSNIANQKVEIAAFIKQFIRASQDKDHQFLGFRNYALSNNWLNNIIKNLKN
ncbi:MAG: TIGR02646 family protein, partial [Methylococcaceae bacterium]|nr:TIGR02646 family protein [Methylococcaceae bacterium]